MQACSRSTTPRWSLATTDALTNLGVETTGLDRFRIDRRGWSPEIAVERGDKHYLAHGHANPLAVVVSPDQRGAALYQDNPAS